MKSALGDGLDHDERLVLDLFIEEFKPQNAYQRFMLGCLVSRIFMEPKECRSRVRLAGYLGISRQRVRQIEDKGLRKVRIWGKFERAELDYLCRITARASRDYGIQ
jgi:Sigma-70, region 4